MPTLSSAGPGDFLPKFQVDDGIHTEKYNAIEEAVEILLASETGALGLNPSSLRLRLLMS